MIILTQQLGVHPLFADVSVNINIEGFFINGNAEIIDIPYSLSYFKNEVDISDKFNPKIPNWTISNEQNMMVRDANFQSIANPDYVEGSEDESEVSQFLMVKAYDYVLDLITVKNIPLIPLLQAYIAEEHSEGRFI